MTDFDPDYAPPGGTSNRNYHHVADAWTLKAFEALRAEADRLGITVSGIDANTLTDTFGLRMAQPRVRFADDPRAEYTLHIALEHRIERAPDNLRSIATVRYGRATEDGLDFEAYEWRFEPPLARDPQMHAELVLAVVAAHHRQRLAELNPPAGPPAIVDGAIAGWTRAGTVTIVNNPRLYDIDPDDKLRDHGTAMVAVGTECPLFRNPGFDTFRWVMTGQRTEPARNRVEDMGDGMFAVIQPTAAITDEQVTFLSKALTVAEMAELCGHEVATDGHPEQRLRIRFTEGAEQRA